MTSPVKFVNPLLWATLTVNGTGFGFATISKTNGTTSTGNTRLVLPEGVNMVTVDWSGKSRVVIQAGTTGLIRKVEIPLQSRVRLGRSHPRSCQHVGCLRERHNLRQRII